MSINNEKTNFRSSLPGKLKGWAAIITAISGLIYAIGYFEDRKKGQNDGHDLPKYASLSGQWDTTAAYIPDNGSKTISCIELIQSGNEVTGVINYYETRDASGAIRKHRDTPSGTIEGIVKGSDVEINYVNSEGKPGTAQLKISADSRNLNGSWTNNTAKTKGSLILRKRDSGCPR